MDSKLYAPDIKILKEQNQNIQVFVRVRPMNGYERSKNSLVVLDCPGNREVVVKERNVNNLTKTFTFDRVFGPTSKQLEVYKTVVAPLVEEVLLGYNCTVFAYGQTGTGKTFTMEGERSPESRIESLSWESDPLTGIVPRAMSQLFDDLRHQNTEFTIRVSLVELYNEELFDLLSSNDENIKTLRLYEDSNRKGSVIIQGLEEVTVHSKDEVYSIMERGSNRRKTAATQMNAHSSRSHTVFTLTVHIKETSIDGEELLKIGKLHLVDLAGSENIGRSGAIEKRAREAGSINQSLLTLGRVITALVEKTPHIPYRESKLTRILQESLGGRTKTSIIATVSPASYNVEETLNTLDYAHRAKNITNRPEINQKLTKRAMLKAYTEEIERLRRDLIATREKNGVYMDKENYDSLTSQLDCQNQDLSENIAQVRLLQETVEQKEGELTCVKQELEETKDDLATANQVLADTRRRLSQTGMKLREAEIHRDQQEHLVQTHVLTERQLTAEAAQLMFTTEESTSNLEKLYRKLDRKKNVEQMNLKAGLQFNDDLGNQFNSICVSMESFRVDHASFCGSQRMKFDTFVQENETQFACLSNQLTNFQKHMSKVLTETTTLVETETKSAKDRTVSVAEKLSSESQKAVAEINVWKAKICNEIIAKLKGHLDGLFVKMNEQGMAFIKQMGTQNMVVDNYVTACIKRLEANVRLAGEFLRDQIVTNNCSKAFAGHTEILVNDYVRTLSITANNLMGELQRMVEDVNSFQSLLVNNSKSQTTCLTNSMVEIDRFTNYLQHESDLNKNEAASLQHSSNINATEGTSFLKDRMELFLENHTENTLCVASVAKEIQNHCINQTEAWTRTHQDVASETETHKDQLKICREKFTEVAKALYTESGDQVKEIVKNIDDDLVSNQAFLTARKDDLGEHCNVISTWVDDTRAFVLQQSGKLHEFWEFTYQVDLPSGATPQRKSYEFPTTLSATSPHEHIINRFTTNRPPEPSNLITADETF